MNTNTDCPFFIFMHNDLLLDVGFVTDDNFLSDCFITTHRHPNIRALNFTWFFIQKETFFGCLLHISIDYNFYIRIVNLKMQIKSISTCWISQNANGKFCHIVYLIRKVDGCIKYSFCGVLKHKRFLNMDLIFVSLILMIEPNADI